MRIGVVSDTHDRRANVARIVEHFNEAAVDRVIHTGDITRPATLEVFAGLDMPLHGVFGNNDLARAELSATAARLGFELVEPPLRLHWARRRIIVIHDRDHHTRAELHTGEVVLYGHDHRFNSERANGRLLFNPGECAGYLQGRNAIGVVDLGTLYTDLVKF